MAKDDGGLIYRIAYPPSEQDYAEGRTEGRPNPPQRAFELLSPKITIHCLIAGFGLGKSLVGARKGIRAMLRNPGSSGMVIAPTYRHADIIRERLVMTLEVAKSRYGVTLLKRQTRTRGQSEVELTNGSIAEFYTAQNRTSWLGADKTWILLDEWEWMEDAETVLDSSIHRLRESSVPGVRTVLERNLFITSTAQTSSGPLRGMRDRAVAEHQKLLNDPTYIPEVACIVAPSHAAIGYGLTADMLRSWKANMGSRAFARGVACDFSPPPEVVYSAVVSNKNLVQWTFQPTCLTYVFFDWGVHKSAWLMAQWSPQHNALVVFREWAPSPDPAGVQEAFVSATSALNEYGLAQQGRPTRPGAVMMIGDPTKNPGASSTTMTEEEIVALDGAAILRGHGWKYSAPGHPWQRSKALQVSLNSALFSSDPPRVYVSQQLAAESARVTKMSMTSKGLWAGLTTGLRYRRDHLGRVSETIDKKTGYDHLHDALCYGNVLIFKDDVATLLQREHALLGGEEG